MLLLQVLTVKFRSRIDLLYRDTDSFMVCLHSLNINKDLEKIQDSLDTSNFNPTHPLYSAKNASELFFVKMELPSHSIIAAVFLKANAYALLINPNKTQFKYENRKNPSSEYKTRPDNVLQLHRCKGVPAVKRN